MKEVKIRIYYQVRGGHTHMRVFVGMNGRNLGKAGDLCMTNEEFVAWQTKQDRLEFIDELKARTDLSMD